MIRGGEFLEVGWPGKLSYFSLLRACCFVARVTPGYLTLAVVSDAQKRKSQYNLFIFNIIEIISGNRTGSNYGQKRNRNLSAYYLKRV